MNQTTDPELAQFASETRAWIKTWAETYGKLPETCDCPLCVYWRDARANLARYDERVNQCR